jgi:hypothetical protein
MTRSWPENTEIADILERAAELLELEDANPFRVRSYRHAAEAVRHLEAPVSERLRDDGQALLTDIPGIGEKLAGSIQEIAETGGLGLVDDLEADLTPEALLATVPGVGTRLASRIHQQLGISTLEDLEAAAHDGRLAEVEGFAEERIDGIRDALAGRLSRSAHRRARRRAAVRDSATARPPEPPVGLILEIDDLYRARVEAGDLRTIAPRRFNPERKRWLPVLETERDGWKVTALFSNTAKAHDLDKIRDWVVIYYATEDGSEGRCTVITSGSAALKGRRVVVGRERECEDFYR